MSSRSALITVILMIAAGATAYYLLAPPIPASTDPLTPALPLESGEVAGQAPPEPLAPTPLALATDAANAATEAATETVARQEAVAISGPSATAEAAYRAERQARRTARMARLAEMPIEERANLLARQWGLSADQEQQVANIMGSYSDELAALDKTAMSDAQRASAQRNIYARQMRELSPVLGDSPRLNQAKERFIEAGTARGGSLQGGYAQ